jgi:gamma-glutamyl:cysteine ligase YbdK (ATP-grasp superfamily)
MIIPPLHGTCTQQKFFIYAACDQKYFDEFGREFVRSVQQNTGLGVHIHVFNPSEHNRLNFVMPLAMYL